MKSCSEFYRSNFVDSLEPKPSDVMSPPIKGA